MRRLVTLVALAGCGRIHFDPADPDATGTVTPWTVVQVAGLLGGTVTVVPTEENNLIVVAVQLKDTDSVGIVADNATGGSSNYLPIPGAVGTDTNPGSRVELWYASPARAGATTVIVDKADAVVAWEVRGSGTIEVDGASGLDDQPGSLTPVGAPITTTVAGAFIVSVAIVQKMALGIRAGNEFTSASSVNANGWAHLAATAAGPHQAQWDQDTSGTSCAATAAFRDGQ